MDTEGKTLRQFVDLVGSTVYELNFMDSHPNLVLFKNISAYPIYVGESPNTGSTSYSKLIPAQTIKKYTNLDGIDKLYLYASGNITDLQVISAEFSDMRINDIDEDLSINASITVGSLPASSNIIGKVKITDGTDELAVETDGSINVNFSGALPAGTNNIGDVDVLSLPALPAGTNNIGDVDVLSLPTLDINSLPALAAGTNNIGDVDVLSLPALPAGTNNIGDVDVLSLPTLDINSLPALAAGTNNIGDVDVLSLPALPAGTNNIGKVQLTDGTDVLAIESDGSINVNFTGSLTAASVTITDGTDTMLVNADGSLNTTINAAIPAGTNNIGDVDIVTVAAGQNVKPATTPVIYNVTCTTAGTEYSQALPSNCKSYSIGIKSKTNGITWVLKFGASGTEFAFDGTETYGQDNLLLATQTLYFESDSSGEIIQIIAYS